MTRQSPRNPLINISYIYIQVLSKLPALRELDVAFNYFTGVILAPEAIEYAFPSLECLDLCFNYITRQDDVSVLVLLERLQRIILYGNPLMGPTGEDPLGLCVKRLLEKADRYKVTHSWVMHITAAIIR